MSDARHRPLFDGPKRFAGDAIEHPDEALLADLRDYVDGLAVVANGQELGRGGIVVIPNVVVHHLEMPEAAAGAGIEGQQAIGEEVRAVAVGAIEIVFGAGGGRVQDAAFFVERKFAPDVGAADSLPGVLGPGVVAELARVRDGVKGPDDLAGAHVEGADVAGRRAVALVGGGAEDQQVFKDAAGRGGLDQRSRSVGRGRVLPSDRPRHRCRRARWAFRCGRRWRAASDWSQNSRRRSVRSLLSQ